MRRIRLFSLVLPLLAAQLGYAQTPDVSYNVTGTLSPSGTFAGSFLLNQTTGLIDGGTFIVANGSDTYSLSSSTNNSPIPTLAYFADANGNTFRLALNAPGGWSTLAFNTFVSIGSCCDTAFTNSSSARFDATGGTIVLAALPPPPPAPVTLTASVWVTVAVESQSTSVTLPAGATYRFGDTANNLWSAPVTVAVETTFSPVFFPAGVFPFADPDIGVTKELDVLETADAQLISVTNLSTDPVTVSSQIVPALAVPPPTHTITFTHFQINTTGQTALMFDFVNAPAAGGARTWEGTQMDATIDGVIWTCTYGQTYTDQVYTLSCVAEAPTTPASN